MSDPAKDKTEKPEKLPEVKAPAEVQRGAVISGQVYQNHWKGMDKAHWLDQDESATGLFFKQGEAGKSSCKFGIDGLEQEAPRANANGTAYQVFTQAAAMSPAKIDPISPELTKGDYQSSVKLNVQITNVPEVSQGVRPEEVLTFTSAVMDAGAKAVRPIEEHLSKPNAVNEDLWNLPGAAMGGLEHLAKSPEQVNKDAAALTGRALDVLDRPMTPEHRAEMAGQILPLFFFEGGKEPIDSNVAKQMNLEQLTDEELAALGIKRRADKIADDKETQKPAEITAEALDNAEGLAKLAKKFGISMPPKDTYVFVGDKDAVSADAAAKHLGVTSEQLKSFDEASLSAHKLERVPDYRDAFFNAYPGLIPIADRLVVHHGLPKWLLKGRYEGLFTARELNDVKYLRGVYSSVNHQMHNRQIHNLWLKFQNEFPNPTKQQALDWLRKVDDEFGKSFAPTEGK